jgi:glycosyltransferase involved in cell wall biosynthesis
MAGSGQATGKRPVVLLVTGHLPYPPVSGGRLRELELLTRLSDRFRFHLFVASRTFEEDRANAPALERSCESVRVWLAGRDPFPSGRATPELVRGIWSPGLAGAAADILASEAVDLVHVERFHLAPHLPAALEVPLLLAEQNIEYSLWHQRMRLARGPQLRRRYVFEYALTVRAEIEAWRRADMVTAVTEEDARTIRSALPDKDVRIVPQGALPPSQGEEPVQGAERGAVVFAANFGYRPNVDAALQLLEHIFPRVRTAFPWARLYLVGNDPPEEILTAAGDSVVVTGRVPSLLPYLARAEVVICPLREGGGMKAKVVEALSLGKAVVTTSIGAQGFGPQASEAMRIEDRPAALARATIDLLRDEVGRRNLEARARRLAASLPTWEEAAEALAACYGDLLVSPADAAAVRPSAPMNPRPARR